jgi:hypothetical protein
MLGAMKNLWLIKANTFSTGLVSVVSTVFLDLDFLAA